MKKIELIGIPVIVIFGTLLHYTYSASGNIILAGFFSAMNESVWEHLKLTFWPGVIWTFFLAFGLGWRSHQNFWFARVSALTISALLIVILFYMYTAILGDNLLLLDLSIFVVSIVVGQRLALKLYSIQPVPPVLTRLALLVVMLEALSFVIFSFWPPNLEIFKPSIH